VGTLIAAIEGLGGLVMLAGVYAELAASLFGFPMTVGRFWKVKTGKDFTDYSYDLQSLDLWVLVMMRFGGRTAPRRDSTPRCSYGGGLSRSSPSQGRYLPT
jgi:hypothetical protein